MWLEKVSCLLSAQENHEVALLVLCVVLKEQKQESECRCDVKPSCSSSQNSQFQLQSRDMVREYSEQSTAALLALPCGCALHVQSALETGFEILLVRSVILPLCEPEEDEGKASDHVDDTAVGRVPLNSAALFLIWTVYGL